MIPTRAGRSFRRAARSGAVSLCILLVSLFAAFDCSASEVSSELEDQPFVTQLLEMAIPVGETRIVPVGQVTRAAVGDPSIVDIVVIGPDLILANAKAPGRTSLHFWTDSGVEFVTVTSYRDLSEVIDQAAGLIGVDTVRLTPAGPSVVLEGFVESSEQKERIVKIATAFFGDVVDLLKAPGAGSTEDEQVRDSILTLIGDADVDVKVVRGKALLTGVVSKMSDKHTVEAIARLYVDEVISLIRVESDEDGAPEGPQAEPQPTDPGVGQLAAVQVIRGTEVTSVVASREEQL